LKTELHGVVGWEDHNFLGNLRDLEVTFKPGVVLYPTRLASGELVAPTQLLPEEKLAISFKQPSFIEARTEGFIKPEFNIYPILVPHYNVNPPDPITDPILGYLEPKASVGVDRLIFRRLFVKLSYTAQVESPFSYIGSSGVQLSTISLSYPELQATLNVIDNKLHPHVGFSIGNIVQYAGGIFGGTAHDIKVQPEGRVYIPLGKRITWATRATVGFILPQNWGDYIRNDLGDAPKFDANNKIIPENHDSVFEVRDLEIALFRGLYSGGPSSNRGYPVRSIGPYSFVPFLNPASVGNQFKKGAACVSAVTNAQNGSATSGPPNTCDSPVGGMSLWEASTELRIDIAGPLSIATFVDASDVSPEVLDIRLNYPHMSVGGGARYDTPVGPIRLDIGYRLDGPFDHPKDSVLDPDVRSDSYGTILKQPIAISAGIGEAF
ncbi:MAG: BamA/TamA family outer membrane protein, partial [Polyangiaceae bacterium]